MNERRVERVARAMCWKHGRDPDEQIATLRPNTIIPLWHSCIIEAQAAVEALAGCLTPEYDSTRDQKREDAFVELD